MQEHTRYKTRNFSRFALPVSAALLVVIGIIFSIIIFIEEEWHWHVFVPLPAFSLFGMITIWFYRKGNELIEITPDRISIIAGSHIKKTLAYSEISVLKYFYVQGYTPPTITLKGVDCKISIDGDMENYPLAVKNLFHHLIQKGRNDLIESYDHQFKEEHGFSK